MLWKNKYPQIANDRKVESAHRTLELFLWCVIEPIWANIKMQSPMLTAALNNGQYMWKCWGPQLPPFSSIQPLKNKIHSNYYKPEWKD